MGDVGCIETCCRLRRRMAISEACYCRRYTFLRTTHEKSCTVEQNDLFFQELFESPDYLLMGKSFINRQHDGSGATG